MVPKQPLPPEKSARLLRAATAASLGTAVVLSIVKLGAWLLTGSVSVLASLIDSMLDLVTSALTLLAVRWSLSPPDDEHRFGHGKAEALAGLGQATFVAGSAVFLVLHAVDRLLHPQPLQNTPAGIGVMVFAIVATGALVLFQRWVVRRTGSTAIRADSLHYVTDLLANASIIVALLVAQAGFPGVDPVFGVVIAGYILYSAWQIGHDAVQTLMDRALPPEVEAAIGAAAMQHPEVLGIHELKTRQAGTDYFIQLHLELDQHLSLFHAHRIADEVEATLAASYPNADILIHQDPVPVDGAKTPPRRATQ